MGQVPQKAKILIIGDGKLAYHLKHFLKSHQINFSQWSRKTFKALDFSNFEWILLAIKDSALEGFYQEHQKELFGKKIIHFSGALSFDWAIGVHPLMTFADQLLDEKTYSKIPFIVDQDFPEIYSFHNPVQLIQAKDKALYHAHCVLAVSTPQIVWQSMLDELSGIGLSREIVAPYFEQILKNFIAEKNPLTGPLARRDLTTININLNALKDENIHNIYRALCEKVGIEL